MGGQLEAGGRQMWQWEHEIFPSDPDTWYYAHFRVEETGTELGLRFEGSRNCPRPWWGVGGRRDWE